MKRLLELINIAPIGPILLPKKPEIIDFTDKITILFLEYDSEYCLYDGNEQDFFKTKEDLLQNIKWLLDRHEAMEVRIMGSYGGNGCCVYKK